VQGFEIGFVEAGGGLQFGDESLIGLLQQGCFDFVQQIGSLIPRRFLGISVPGR
jgi:hypothetical protein